MGQLFTSDGKELSGKWLLVHQKTSYKTLLDSLDQVYPVVDGGPVEECYVFFVWLPNIEARLHQLPAALEDAVPEEERRGMD